MSIVAEVSPKVREDAFDAGVMDKVHHLVAIYGVSGLAVLVGVSKSQPTRWRQGRERPSEPVTRRLLALDYLTSRLAEVFTARQAQAWWQGPNPHLGGASPAQAFTRFGAGVVEPAISAAEVGAAV